MNPIAWDKIKDVAITPERAPNDGEWAFFDNGVDAQGRPLWGKKQYHTPVIIDPDVVKAEEETAWRDSELERTDILSLLTDHPRKSDILVYRAALRTYPNQPDFPNGGRPVL